MNLLSDPAKFSDKSKTSLAIVTILEKVYEFYKDPGKFHRETKFGLCCAIDDAVRSIYLNYSFTASEIFKAKIIAKEYISVYRPKHTYNNGPFWFKHGEIQPRLKIIIKAVRDAKKDLSSKQ